MSATAPAKKAAAPKAAKKEAASGKKIAVILVRGRIGIKQDILRTLDQLRLGKKHVCVVVPDNASIRGMLQKIKDAATYGPITDETLALLVEKRGKKDAQGVLKPYFTLNPPRGGFERKGLKVPFVLGGALGNRGEKMDDLVRRML